MIRWIVTLLLVAAFVWFAVNVKLGKRTLVGHVRAIVRTQAARDLANGTMQEAKRTADKLRDEKKSPPSQKLPALPPQPTRPMDSLTDDDRKGLDQLVKEKAR